MEESSFHDAGEVKALVNALDDVLGGAGSLRSFEAQLSKCFLHSLKAPSSVKSLDATSTLDLTALLLAAARAGNTGVCGVLLRHGASVDASDSQGISPLHCAVFGGNGTLVNLLLEHYADANTRDSAGQPPLFFAPSRPVCERLAKAQADVNARNNLQQTALHLAAHAGMVETLEWLSSNIDPSLLNALDSSGYTAADYAIRSKSKSTARLLRLRGAKRSQDAATAATFLGTSWPPVRPSSSCGDRHVNARNVYKPGRGGSRFIRHRRLVPHSHLERPRTMAAKELQVDVWDEEAESPDAMIPESKKVPSAWKDERTRGQEAKEVYRYGDVALAGCGVMLAGGDDHIFSPVEPFSPDLDVDEEVAMVNSAGDGEGRGVLDAMASSVGAPETDAAAGVATAGATDAVGRWPLRAETALGVHPAPQSQHFDSAVRLPNRPATIPETDANLAAELRKERLGNLKKKASEMGVEQDKLNTADDEEDPKRAVIELILEKQAKQAKVAGDSPAAKVPKEDKTTTEAASTEESKPPAEPQTPDAAAKVANAAAKKMHELPFAFEAWNADKAAARAESMEESKDVAEPPTSDVRREDARRAEESQALATEVSVEDAHAARRLPASDVLKEDKPIAMAEPAEEAKVARGPLIGIFGDVNIVCEDILGISEKAEATDTSRDATPMADTGSPKQSKTVAEPLTANSSTGLDRRSEVPQAADAFKEGRLAAMTEPTAEAKLTIPGDVNHGCEKMLALEVGAEATERSKDSKPITEGGPAKESKPAVEPLTAIASAEVAKTTEAPQAADAVKEHMPAAIAEPAEEAKPAIGSLSGIVGDVSAVCEATLVLEDSAEATETPRDHTPNADSGSAKESTQAAESLTAAASREAAQMTEMPQEADALKEETPAAIAEPAEEASPSVVSQNGTWRAPVSVCEDALALGEAADATEKTKECTPIADSGSAKQPKPAVEPLTAASSTEVAKVSEVPQAAGALKEDVPAAMAEPAVEAALAVGSLDDIRGDVNDACEEMFILQDEAEATETTKETTPIAERGSAEQIKQSAAPLAEHASAEVANIRELPQAANSLKEDETITKANDQLCTARAQSPQPEHWPDADLRYSCPMWNVFLERGSDPLGFEVKNLKAEDLDVLIVSEISPTGPLADWNAQWSYAAVHAGDAIVGVNSSSDPDSMQMKLTEPTLVLTLMRPPTHFNVNLRRNGQRLGLNFKKANSAYGSLRVVEVCADGALAAYNSAHRRSGRWYLVVLPGMMISMVNGISAQTEEMVQALTNSEVVNLRLCREKNSFHRSHTGVTTLTSAPVRVVDASEATAEEAYARDSVAVQSNVNVPSEVNSKSGMIWQHPWIVKIDPALQGDLGMEVLDFRSLCRKLLSMDIGSDVVLVSRVLAQGQLSAWNESFPHMKVQEGDYIREVNGKQGVEDITGELQKPFAQIQVARPPERITLRLNKKLGAVGLTYKKPSQSNNSCLRIVEITSGSQVAAHNATAATSGSWERLVLPEMFICAVNGIGDSAELMAQALASSQEIELHILRSLQAHSCPESILQNPTSLDAPVLWEVVVRSQAPRSAEDTCLGFETLDFRERCREKNGHDIGADVLQVSKIFPSGSLATWNTDHPTAAVKDGDCILKVDAVTAKTKMLDILRSLPHGDACKLLVARPCRALERVGIAQAMVTRHESALVGRSQSQSSMSGAFSLQSLQSQSRKEPRRATFWNFAGDEDTSSWKVSISILGEVAISVSDFLGLEISNHRETCQIQLGLDIQMDVLLVSSIRRLGALATWNETNPDDEVREGDRILSVNGFGNSRRILTELESQRSHGYLNTLRLSRPLRCFCVGIDKRGRSLGLNFKRPKQSKAQCLLIVEVRDGGLIAEYNSSKLAFGRWDLVVTPNMLITKVNGLSGDATQMLEAISSAQEVELEFQRADFASVSSPLPSPRSEAESERTLCCQPISPISPWVAAHAPCWDVVLPVTDDIGLGFDVLDFRERIRQTLGEDIGTDVLLVANVSFAGQLSLWNATHPGKEMREGDLILNVNGVRGKAGIDTELQRTGSCEHIFSITRPPCQFRLQIDKQGRTLGLGLDQLSNAASHCLLIRHVALDGLMAEFNSRQLSAGRWDLIVLPGMSVSKLNSIEDDASRILEAVRAQQPFELEIQRFAHPPLTLPSTLPEIQGDVLVWQVTPSKCDDQNLAESQSLGCDTLNFREHCFTQLKIDIKLDILIISTIHPVGLLAEWNQQHPEAEVKPGDVILSASSSASSAKQVQAPLSLNVGRPPAFFDVQLDRTPSGRSLGLGLKRLRDCPVQSLLINEVVPYGVLAEHNAQQLARGRWDLIVLPEMVICAVNHIEDDVDGMLTLLESREIRLRIQRVLPSQVAANPDYPNSLASNSPESAFHVHLRRGGRKLGAGFQAFNPCTLLVSHVLPEGVISDYNSRQISEGSDDLILPEMLISSVNGCTGDVSKMLEALNTADVLELKVHRLWGTQAATTKSLVELESFQQTAQASDALHQWDVSFTRGIGEPGVGFDILDFRESCQEQLSIDIGEEVVIVSAIDPAGPLAAWNSERPDKSVREGDQILLLSGFFRSAKDIKQNLNVQPMQMRLTRPQWGSNVRLKKSELPLGLGVRNVENPGGHLLIVSVSTGGAVAAYNAEQVMAGRWERLVLPGMYIKSVNGVDDDGSKMLNTLSSCQELDLVVLPCSVQIRRAG